MSDNRTTDPARSSTKKIAFHEAQKEIARDPHRFRVVNCGRRFGKTFLSVQEMITAAQNTRDGKIVYIAPTYKQAKDIAWEELKKQASNITIKANESSLEMTVRSHYPLRDHITNKLVLTKDYNPQFLPSTSKIFLRGWEAVESLRGQSYHFVILDEVASMKYFDYSWKTVVFPTLTDHMARVLFLSTPKGFNHFYSLFNMEGRDTDFKSFHFPSTANPHLPVEALEKARIALSPEQYAQEYDAEFKKREGLVYQSFHRDQHTYNPHITTLPPVSEVFYGIDFGFTNPAAVVVIQKDRDKNYWITEEVYTTQKTNTQLIEIVKNLRPQPRYIYADPAEPDRIKEFSHAGYYSREVKKGKGSIILGIDRIQELLKTNRLKISLACPNLINEFEIYAYPDRKENHNEAELPIDEDNHCFVRGTKIILASGAERNIEDIRVGDIVKTETGIGEVLVAGKTKEKQPTIETVFANGSRLISTEKHKIYTISSLIAIDALRNYDIIKINYKLNLSLWRKLLLLMVKGLDGTVFTTRRLVAYLLRRGGIDYTERFGNITMAQYQQGFIFTTWIRIKKTILSKILNLEKQKGIYLNTVKKIGKIQKEEKKDLSTLIMSETSQKNGTRQKKVESGTKNMGSWVGLGKWLARLFVSNVGKSMKHSSPKDQDFVTKIVRQKRLGLEDVYNITVQGEHNYYANGILVKNCLDAMRYALMTHDPLSQGAGNVFGTASHSSAYRQPHPVYGKQSLINNQNRKSNILR